MPRSKLKSASKSKLAGDLRHAIGAGPDEEVNVRTSQFERTPGDPGPVRPPTRLADWEALRDLPRPVLRELGLRPWNASGLMLFPGEWYRAIPEGFAVTSISGKTLAWKRRRGRDDIRFGCLAFGIVPAEQAVMRPLTKCANGCDKPPKPAPSPPSPQGRIPTHQTNGRPR